MKVRWNGADFAQMRQCPLPIVQEDIDLVHRGIEKRARWPPRTRIRTAWLAIRLQRLWRRSSLSGAARLEEVASASGKLAAFPSHTKVRPRPLSRLSGS